MEEELCSSKMNNAEVNRLQRELTSLQGKLDDVSTKMDQSAKDLQREQTKNKSVSKHTQVWTLPASSLLYTQLTAFEGVHVFISVQLFISSS